ncbi:MFS transporter [Ferrovibrio xuzhouensis]|uniref:MFS transporter n=1 Tax=Ferrovibrio xuzhouensis TaxID=1576914 RepID=A0ABV7VGW5_9PROT
MSSLPATTAALPATFRRLAWSNLAAQSAEQVGLAAAPIVAVLALGAGAAETGLLQTAQTLPFLLLAIPAGLLADRRSRRALMVLAETLRAASLAAVVLCVAGHVLSLPLLAMLGFIGAAGTVAYSVAAPSLIPALVPRAQLSLANGRIELARTVAFAAGPAVAGALVGWTGALPAFTVAALLSAGAALLLAGLAEPPRPVRPPRHPLHDLREGAGFTFRHRLLRPVLLTQVIFNIGLFVLQAVFVPWAVHRLGLSAAGTGSVLAFYGLGMVAGALLSQHVLRQLPFGIVVSIGPVAGFVAALMMMATIWLPSPVLAGLGFFLIGAGPILWVISTTTLRQTVAPQDMLGRVSALFLMAQGGRPVGAAIGAAVGALWGMEACLIIAAVIFALQALVILLSPLLRLAALPDALPAAA